MTYDPQVDDYVIWKRPSGDWDEGWVYFKGDPKLSLGCGVLRFSV